jgi:hypothetical protein
MTNVIKDMLGFIRWAFQKLDRWYLSMIAIVWAMVVAVFLPTPYDRYLYIGTCIGIMVLCISGLAWPMIKESWTRYKKEKYGLLDVIKGSTNDL